MAHAHATIGRGRYAVTINADGHALVSDEPKSNGGGNAGPGPYELLLASLGACTAITLRMYADRKNWELDSVKVDLSYTREDKAERIERRLHLVGQLDEEQRKRIAEIAERTPVTLTLKRGISITTEVAPVA